MGTLTLLAALLAFQDAPEDAETKALAKIQELQKRQPVDDEALMSAKMDYMDALFRRAERDRANAAPVLEKLIAFYDQFKWDYDGRLCVPAAAITVGRALQMLAEGAAPAKAEEFWNRCFGTIGMGRAALSPENRKDENVGQVAMESCTYEMRAILAHSDTRKGGAAARRCLDAVKIAEELFRILPSAPASEPGKWIRLELARACCRAGRIERGLKLLDELKKDNTNPGIEDGIREMQADYATDPHVLVEVGDNFSSRSPSWLPKALPFYRRAIGAIENRDDPDVAWCWYRIGFCYCHLDRWWEAAAACAPLERAPFVGTPIGGKAALIKLQCLQRIEKITGTKADAAAASDFLMWVSAHYPGDLVSRLAAIRLEKDGKFLEAAEKWAQISKNPGSSIYGEALFCMGYDHYRHAKTLKMADRGPNYERALGSLRAYLDWYGRLKQPERTATDDALASIQIAMEILMRERKCEDALEISSAVEKRFPTGRTPNVMKLLGLRIEAQIGLGKLEGAEQDLREMRARYAAEHLGVDAFVRALGLMAEAWDGAAQSVKAGEAYYEYFQLKPPDPRDAALLEAVAGKFFTVAERKSGAEARDFANRARDLFEQLLAQQKPGAPTRAVLVRRVARCFMMAGRFEEAIGRYHELTGPDPMRQSLPNWEELADCHMAYAAAMTAGRLRNDQIESAIGIYADFQTRLKALKNEHYWRMMYKRASALLEFDLEQLVIFFRMMDKGGHAPEWDGGAFRPKFEELRRKLREKVPSASK